MSFPVLGEQRLASSFPVWRPRKCNCCFANCLVSLTCNGAILRYFVNHRGSASSATLEAMNVLQVGSEILRDRQLISMPPSHGFARILKPALRSFPPVSPLARLLNLRLLPHVLAACLPIAEIQHEIEEREELQRAIHVLIASTTAPGVTVVARHATRTILSRADNDSIGACFACKCLCIQTTAANAPFLMRCQLFPVPNPKSEVGFRFRDPRACATL